MAVPALFSAADALALVSAIQSAKKAPSPLDAASLQQSLPQLPASEELPRVVLEKQPFPAYLWSDTENPYEPIVKDIRDRLETRTQKLEALPMLAPLQLPMNRELALGSLLAGLLTGGPGASLAGGFLKGGVETAREQQALQNAALQAQRDMLARMVMAGEENYARVGGFGAQAQAQRELAKTQAAQAWEEAQMDAKLAVQQAQLDAERWKANRDELWERFKAELLLDQRQQERMNQVLERAKPWLDMAMQSGDPRLVGTAVGYMANSAKAAGIQLTDAEIARAVSAIQGQFSRKKTLEELGIKTEQAKLSALETQAKVAKETAPYEIEAAKYLPAQAREQVAALQRSNRPTGGGGGGGSVSVSDWLRLQKAEQEAREKAARPALDAYKSALQAYQDIEKEANREKDPLVREQMMVSANVKLKRAMQNLRVAMAQDPSLMHRMYVPPELWPHSQINNGYAFEQYTRQLTQLYDADTIVAMYEKMLRKYTDLPAQGNSAIQSNVAQMRRYVDAIKRGGTRFGPDGTYLGKMVFPNQPKTHQPKPQQSSKTNTKEQAQSGNTNVEVLYIRRDQQKKK